ncbi:MAG: hypothetical protein OHK0046_49390 [Anaerolineae bacterium]
MNNTRMPSDHIGVLIAALVMVVIGVGGGVLLILNNPPRLGAELWLFFILGHLAITGIAIPVVRYLNVRLTPISDDPPPGGVIVRQSIWIGLFFVICAWLQILRALSFPAAFFIALVLVVIEVFLRYRELSGTA